MTCPPVLVPPQQGKPFKLYISTDNQTLGSALMQEFNGKERVVFYLIGGFWIQRQDILPSRSYAYAYISLALSYDITCCRLSVQLSPRLM